MSGKKHLTPRNERFALELFKGTTLIDAYIKAYNPSSKTQRQTLRNSATKLAHNPKIKARVAELMEPVIQNALLTKERWLQEVVNCALFDPRELFDSHGNCIEIKELPDNVAAAIAGFEQFEEFEGRGESRKATGYTRKFKLIDKLKALELAGKAYKFYEEGDANGSKIPHNLNITFTDRRSPHITATVEPQPIAEQVAFVPSR